MQVLARSLVFVFLSCAGQLCVAQPAYIPASDDEVLLTLKAYTQSPVLDRLIERWEADKENAMHASALASHYIQLGQAHSDARYFGYAKAALRPWGEQASVPESILLARGVLHQRIHAFAQATRDIEAALRANPRNAQAWLILAMINLAEGDYGKARASCSGLSRNANLVISSGCFANAMALTGQAERAYQILSALSQQAGDSPINQWLLTSRGNIAVQLGEYEKSIELYERALLTGQRDPYLLKTYADLLLGNGNPERVIKLLELDTHDDALLLRYAIAARNTGDSDLADDKLRTFRARLQAEKLRGGQAHWLDEALYVLEFENDPRRALELGLTDWKDQKGLDGARLIIRAANASGNHAALVKISKWIDQMGLEDHILDSMIPRGIRMKF